MKKDKSFIFGLGLSLAFVLIFGGVLAANVISKKSSKVQSDNSGSFKTVEDSQFSKSAHSIEEVAEKISPSVVSIISSGSKRSLFGTQEYQSAGTGFIVTADGYIITNKHVIDGKSSVSVVMNDGETFENVKVVAKDPLNDIAFLKIDGKNDFSPAELGDSKVVKVGQEVVAFGNALGQYQNTITSGIISGLNRSIEASSSSNYDEESLSGLIQTDAAINSGNSGGPLVNARGQVIGINTAKATDSDGIGFAIPIGSAKGMLKSLIEKGAAGRASLGVNYMPITPQIAKSQKLPIKYGAYIYNSSGSAVLRGSAAESAGLKNGDIIAEINGAKVGESGSLINLVSEYSVGEEVKLTVYRAQEKIEISLTLSEYNS